MHRFYRYGWMTLLLIASHGVAQKAPSSGDVAPPRVAPQGAEVLELELEKKLYFTLPPTLAHVSDLRPEQKEFFEGVLAHHEGRFDEARRLLIAALNAQPTILTSKQKVEAFETLGEGALLTSRYGGCAQMFSDIDQIWGSRLGAGESGIVQQRHLCAVQQHTPLQTISFAAPFTLRRQAGAYLIQVGTVKSDAMLDTDSSESVITDSTARAWGVAAGEGSVVMYGYSGGAFTGHTGVVPQLTLGTATLHNVAVLIVPDATFPVAAGATRPHALLGLPVLFALGRLSFTQDGTLTASPASPADAAQEGCPLWIGETELLVQLRTLDATGRSFHYASGDEQRLFALDTGSRDSYLTDHYLEEHRELFPGAPKAAAKLAGAGGEADIPAYDAVAQPLWCGSSAVYLNGPHVLTTPLPGFVEAYEGLIGQDVLSDVQSYTLDLRAMRFSMQPFPAR